MASTATDTQMQSLVGTILNVSTDTNITGVIIPTVWAQYNGQGQLLQYVYTLRTCALYLMGLSRNQQDVQIGPDRVTASQVFEHSMDIYNAANADIKRLDPHAGAPTLVSVAPDSDLPDAIEEEMMRVYAGLSPLNRLLLLP